MSTDTLGRPEREQAGAPLDRFPVIATRSLEEARDAVTRVYLPHELTASNDRVDMTLNAVSDHHFTLGYLTYHAHTKLVMPPTESCYHVNLTTAGETDADRTDGARERTLAGERGLVLNPLQRNTVRWTPEAEQLILNRRLADQDAACRSAAPGRGVGTRFEEWWSLSDRMGRRRVPLPRPAGASAPLDTGVTLMA